MAGPSSPNTFCTAYARRCTAINQSRSRRVRAVSHGTDFVFDSDGGDGTCAGSAVVVVGVLEVLSTLLRRPDSLEHASSSNHDIRRSIQKRCCLQRDTYVSHQGSTRSFVCEPERFGTFATALYCK